ncbi:dual 3',5'-cyclic-AMP and -GMP phosphodiesterase 11 isoform X2 [Lutzomyia longipalpis]|uniref:dual 3',5'-cyclic-AMP and -GMP phosphodiesterase 11 isoform X2 n=1 Tax=Lutzomyia longipalpis TaxID=7200 RepID=UPI002483C92A|nr:dual 3',5'-cyclic-AMP and -GMP phosphodiesterase 11 isoform X2 [Lutzomyia longipalpis]XP_055685170.1 dual 3',5'-cyclic-AMP and -GMP phosphodiesterase 11 isoform X2 [Lutzomyia longipalpis]XP_055685172.1 dual 3',5'-cyclic-AMP and -GMP phosphodiesterase 11 isoform X2 [Lutzomyia longipalpis]XP_055685173.1 dual 3',5'-cyclic-AMP and -GMP phosphodiesterase 11 isoform X2 [Lutzomyia longipalpis]XP_055685174.1 dual 3',5'-cyclic-AMP and -GMP phosphodiesterase 11 isoform X2 [Lutzomyia longipalpis]
MGQTSSMCRFRGCRYKKSLHLRSIDAPQNRMPAEQGGPDSGTRSGVPLPLQLPAPDTQVSYDAEYARMEAWLDENPEFTQDYFIRKATRQVVDAWLVNHATPGAEMSSPTYNTGACSSRGGSGATTPVRKISAHEFERGGLLKPIVNTIDGTPTFLSVGCQNDGAAGGSTALVAGASGGGGGWGRPQRLSRNELKLLDEKELIFELVKDICNELDVRSLCHKILQNVSILLNADRGSLFLVQGRTNACQNGPKKCLVSKLFDVCPRSTLEEMEQQEEVRVAWGTGIAGHVAESGEPVNIPDAYQDERFNREIDLQTGYRTKALLCMPIKDATGDVVGVAQVINKLNGDSFTENDEKVFVRYLQFCGIGLRNAQLYEKSQLEVKRNQVLLDLARMIFEEQSTIEYMVFRILTHMQSLIQCQRVQILLVHEASKGTFSRVFDFEPNDLSEDGSQTRTSPYESRFPINVGITGFVAMTGETVNIPNVNEDHRFDQSVDEGQCFKHKSILCMAIKNSLGQIIGVIQLVNKFNDLIFTKNDENFVEAFAIFCGMGIHNTHMYEKAVVAMAKQSVTLEVLSYHVAASIDDAVRLRRLKVPSAAFFKLHDFRFDDIHMEDNDTLLASLRMFYDLSLVDRFNIDTDVLCRWLLSVKRNYRHVTYHNWRHAFNVTQMMFAILTTTQWWKIFGDIECLALVIACLCHDLDHRGTNNSFQIKASSPLAQLYSTSTMEHHHFDHCLLILNSPGNQILSNLSSDDYSKVIHILEDAILSTDLAVYFRKRGPFLNAVKPNSMNYWLADESRSLLRAMSMTVCDLSAITKPWEIEKRVADLVSSEFFEQGDMERQELNITPIDIMDREKEDQLPMMQVGFIDSICLPIYEAFAVLSPKLDPLVEGVRNNREQWLKLAQSCNRKAKNVRHNSIPSLTNHNNNHINNHHPARRSISNVSSSLVNRDSCLRTPKIVGKMNCCANSATVNCTAKLNGTASTKKLLESQDYCNHQVTDQWAE